MKKRRMTKQRQLILDMIQKQHNHPTAEEIYSQVTEIDKKVSRGTVYRNLGLLKTDGNIGSLNLTNPERFEGRLDYHHHLICIKCGKICDVPLPYVSELDTTIANETGYTISRHHTIFEGICPECEKKNIE